MRKWRVGTVSMGATLILLGVMLLLSSTSGMDATSIGVTWWPVLLIVLGGEVLVYLFTAKQEKPVVHYDFVSIFFIGILGTVGMALYTVASLGLVEEVKAQVSGERIEKPLPTLERSIAEEIRTIVVQAGQQPLTIETNKSGEARLFGSYSTNVHKERDLTLEDIVQTNRVDDTLYVQLLNGPGEGNYSEGIRFSPILSLPYDVAVEVRGEPYEMNMAIDELGADWSIEEAGYVELQVENDVDATVKTLMPEETHGEVNSTKEEPFGDSGLVERMKVFGEGTHTIRFSRVDQLELR